MTIPGSFLLSGCWDLTKHFYDGRWRDVRRHGVGMVGELLTGLVAQTKAKDPSYDFTEMLIASLAVRIVAAHGTPGETFMYLGNPSTDPSVQAAAALVHGPEVGQLVSRSSASRVTDCLRAAARLGVNVDLVGLEAKWWILDRTHDRGLPDDQRLAFEAVWMVGHHGLALRLLHRYLRSVDGKAWLADTPPIVLDQPLDQLVAMRAALARKG